MWILTFDGKLVCTDGALIAVARTKRPDHFAVVLDPPGERRVVLLLGSLEQCKDRLLAMAEATDCFEMVDGMVPAARFGLPDDASGGFDQ